MKHIFLFLTITLFIHSNAQTAKAMYKSKVFSSTGAFTSPNNEATGYFNISYKKNKKSKTLNYIITLRDINFNAIAEKKIETTMRSYIIGTASIGNYLALAFYDTKQGIYTIKVFDNLANLHLTETISYTNRKDISRSSKQILMGNFYESINFVGVPNQGFLLTYPGDYGVVKKGGFNTKAALIKVNKASGKHLIKLNVKRNSFEKGTALRLEVLASNAKFIALKKLDGFSSINIFNATDGSLNFSTKENELDSVYVNKAFFNTSNNLVYLGDYFSNNRKDKIKNKSKGFYYKEIDPNGETINFHKVKWDVILSSFPDLKKSNKLNNLGFLYLHNILQTNNGFLALFETYKLTNKVLKSNGSSKQLTTNDAFMFSFDSSFNLTKTKQVEKFKSRWKGASSFYTERYNAQLAALYGGFDYLHYQKDENRNRYYFYFYDYERKKNEANGYAIKTIIFEDDSFFEDKLVISSEASEHKVLPAEIGEILILEYFRKSGKSNIRKERFSLD